MPLAYANEDAGTLDLPEKKVIIQGKEITGKMINGQTYIPVAELMGLKYPISPIHVTIEEDRIIFEEKYPFITDIQQAKEQLYKIYESSQKRIQEFKDFKKSESYLEKYDKYLREVLGDIMRLEKINVNEYFTLCLKNTLHSYLNQEVITYITYTTAIKVNDKINNTKYRLLKSHQPNILKLIDIYFTVYSNCLEKALEENRFYFVPYPEEDNISNNIETEQETER